ncbi:MAG: hypothetical protein ACHP7I_03225 [Terriglobales bacterium]
MDNLLEHYQIVLQDLERKRAKYKADLADIEQAIGGIRKLMATNASLFAAMPQQAQPAKYAGMSVRWAIMNFLAEDVGNVPIVDTATIAQALLNGGITSRGQNFNSNVSAVLSTMKERGEVEQLETGSYQLTPHGANVWHTIKLTPQYRNRVSDQSIVQ